jgi:hypothetical protein
MDETQKDFRIDRGAQHVQLSHAAASLIAAQYFNPSVILTYVSARYKSAPRLLAA